MLEIICLNGTYFACKKWTMLFLMASMVCPMLTAQSALIDVRSYDFTIQLSDRHDTLIGLAVIEMDALRDAVEFWLELDQLRADGTGMVASEVSINGAILDFQQEGNKVNIRAPLRSGEQFRCEIRYQGIPNKGLIISTNRYGDRTFFADNWPNWAHAWLPCIDHPLDKATVTFRVHTPEYFEVVGSGRLVEETNLGDGHKITVWHSPHLLPTKSMVIGIARFATAYDEINDVPVSRWVFHQDRDQGFENYDWSGPILTCFENLIGPYPFEKLAHVQSKTRWGGSENSGTIFYFEASTDAERDNEALFAHEIAHQWFGNSASEADWYHVWLSEGFATYFTHLYFEDRYGVAALRNRMLKDRQRIIEYYHQKPNEAIIQKKVENLDDILSVNSYQKGSWFLHMLREEVGDSVFWQGMQSYYKKYAYDNALTQDFQAIFEQVSNRSLGAFFRQWLHQSGHPQISTSWNYYNGVLTFEVEQHQEQKFDFALPIGIRLPDSTIQFHAVQMDRRKVSVPFHIDVPPAEVLLDPMVQLLYEKIE